MELIAIKYINSVKTDFIILRCDVIHRDVRTWMFWRLQCPTTARP